MTGLRSSLGVALMVLLLLLAVSVPSVVMGCYCPPGYKKLHKAVESNTVAMIDIGQEVIVNLNDDTFPQQRYWQAKVVDVFKGCRLVAGTSIYVRTAMDAATCGADLQDWTRYLLTGTAWPAEYQRDELNYDGDILWVDICHYTKPWADVTTQELEIIYALPEPNCDVVNCESCDIGYFDECSSCDCKGPDGHGSGNHSICTTNTCPLGTQTTAPMCRCSGFTRVCPDNTSRQRQLLPVCHLPAAARVDRLLSSL
jgi:hypothetical protein